jgi:D-alanyl-D-alanine-carboxypeptidase/D-alanyl-D-alanine-endopeptidase
MFFTKGIIFIIFIIVYFKNNYLQFIKIDKKIEDIINPLTNDSNVNQRFVGIAVGIIKDNHERFYSFGSVDQNKNEKPKKNTIFEIGSITKTFTASLLADAHLRGILDINDHIEKCNSNITNAFCFEGTPISLANLSTHTSGYPKMPDNLPLTSETPFDYYYREHLDKFLSNYTLLRKPGSLFEYSNVGVGMLGIYLSDRQNSSYENLLEKTILKPYKLYDTKMDLNNEQKLRFAKGYLSGIETPHWWQKRSAIAACGALHSTVDDMLKYLRLQIFSENEIFKFTHVERYIIDSKSSMGLGWIRERVDNFITHNGGTYGFTSFVGFDKNTKVGVVILANSYILNDTKIDEAGTRIINIIRSIK